MNRLSKVSGSTSSRSKKSISSLFGVFIISLKKEETDIIERLNETYLYGKEQQTQNSFSKTIKKWSKELLGQPVTINDYRRRFFTNIMNNLKNVDFPQSYEIVKDIAKKSNTSIEQMITYYYSSSNNLI